MNRDRGTGLRLRLFAIILGAGLVAAAPLAIVVLLQVRDALYGRRVADGRERLRAAQAAIFQQCPESGGPPGCEMSLALAAGAVSVSGERLCTVALERRGEQAVLCEPLRAGSALQLSLDLAPVREELGALDARIFAAFTVFLVLLVTIATFLLDRGVVRRLTLVDEALDRVDAEQEGAQLLAEGGDAVGRLGAAVNRLSQRLGEERQRTRAQIGALEQANVAIREARQDLLRSERLASVGRLAAGVAHEVGNPVAALLGYAAVMRDRLRQGKDVSEYAERVEREATRIDRILRDLLDLARPKAVRLENVALEAAVGQARFLLAPQSGWEQIALATDLPAGLPNVIAEEHYLVQVLVNLLTNAQRAGAKSVRISARAEGGEVIAEVADDGRGIAPDLLPRLFEPFVTSAAPGEGTGLGLALCHATMERIGGRISARAGEGKGAVFELRFRGAGAA